MKQKSAQSMSTEKTTLSEAQVEAIAKALYAYEREEGSFYWSEHLESVREEWRANVRVVAKEIAALGAATEEVWELKYCESLRLSLHPGVLYRFKVDPDCASCRRMAKEHEPDVSLCPAECELAHPASPGVST